MHRNSCILFSEVYFFQLFKQKSLDIAFEMRYTAARRVCSGSLGIPTREEPGIPVQPAAKRTRKHKHIDNNNMKKTIIALLALAGVAAAAEQQITLTGLTGGGYSSTTANYSLTWDTTNVETTLVSWKLTFDMTPTGNDGEWVFKVPAVDNNPGIIIQKYAGKLWINATNEAQNGGTYLPDYGMPLNTAVAVTLSYVANENLEGLLSGGLFTLSAAYTNSGETTETTFSCTREFSADYTTALTSGAAELNVHGGKTSFANISLTQLDNNMVVPEPTTATLSLLALAGLAARRRRK